MINAHSSDTCQIPGEIISNFKKFKIAKNTINSAYILKIDKNTLTVEFDEQIDNIKLEDLAEQLPEAAPRYICYSYKHTHKDGRSVFPLVFIFYCPSSNPTLQMLYASTKQRLVQSLEVMKDFEVRASADLSEQWLKDKLGLKD